MEKGFTINNLSVTYFLRPILIKKGRVIESPEKLFYVLIWKMLFSVQEQIYLISFIKEIRYICSGIDNKVYCCVWSEYTDGRNANYIASALVKVLRQFVLEHSNVTEIILWSDSCVPQNRNSILAFALKGFMLENTHVKTITQKFSEKSHSLVQEVDNAHSCIKKNLRKE